MIVLHKRAHEEEDNILSVLIILTLTFIQGHTDLNHENNKMFDFPSDAESSEVRHNPGLAVSGVTCL